MARSHALGIALSLGVLLPAMAQQQEGPVQLTPLRSLEALRGNVTAAAFSPSGDALAYGTVEGELLVFDMPGQQVRWRSRTYPRNRQPKWVGTIAFSPDGKHVACVGAHLTVLDARTGIAEYQVSDTGPHGFDWSDDSARFAYARGKQIFCHRLGDKKADETLGTLGVEITSLSFAPDGAVMVGDRVGSVWRLAAGTNVATFHRDYQIGHTENVRLVAVECCKDVRFEVPSRGPIRRNKVEYLREGVTFEFASTGDGASWALGGEDPVDGGTSEYVVSDRQSTVRWWEHGGKKRSDIRVPGRVSALALHPNGKDLFVSTYKGHCAIYRTGQLLRTLTGVPARIRDIRLSADASNLAVNANGWALHTVDGSAVRMLDQAVDVRPGNQDAQFVVQERQRATLLDGRTGAELSVYDLGKTFLSLDLPALPGPGSHVLVARRVLDRNSEVVAQLPAEFWASQLQDHAHAADGSWAIAGISGTVANWGGLFLGDALGKTRKVLDGIAVFTVAFSPDSERVYYSTNVNTAFGNRPRPQAMHVFDICKMKVVDTHQVSCTRWRFLDNRHALAAVGTQLRVWDVSEMKPIQTLTLPAPCRTFELSLEHGLLATHGSHQVHLHRLQFTPAR